MNEKYNAGALTNFEVLEFLKSRGASKDPSRVMAPIAPSEFKIIEKADYRLGLKGLEELVEMVVEVLPAPPYEPKFDEETAEEANTDDETAEMANADEENAIADEEIATEEQTVGS
ncbi:hypothetical protein V2J09_020319 [Rumex salicifolius]